MTAAAESIRCIALILLLYPVTGWELCSFIATRR